MAHITNEEVRRRTGQPPVTSVIAKRRLDFVCSDILREPTHHKTTRAFFEQPSIVLQQIGDAGQIDQGGHGSVQLSSTFSPITLVLTQRGCMRRIVQSGVSLWRRLCSLMGALLDDDDDKQQRPLLRIALRGAVKTLSKNDGIIEYTNLIKTLGKSEF